MSDVLAVGEYISNPWTPRRIVEIKRYTGKFRDLFDCVLVIQADTRKGTVESAYNSSNWLADQERVRAWERENGSYR